MKLYEYSSGPDLFGVMNVSVPDRNLLRIFAFRISNFGNPNYQLEIKHNQVTFHRFQASDDEEAMFCQTDDLPAGQQAILELMDQLHDSTYKDLQSEKAETARRSGLRAMASAELTCNFEKPEIFEAICDELLALPESDTPWQESSPIVAH